MTSRSSKLVTPTEPRRRQGLLLLALTVVAVLLPSVPRGDAQSSVLTPGSPSRPKGAYVRFWNMLPPNTPEGVQLQLLATGDQPLTVAPAGNYYAGYFSLPPASYSFTVRRPDADPANPLRRLAPVSLRADSYTTILVAQKDGRPNVEVIDDTPDPKAPADTPGRVIIRQFIPGARVTVTANRTIASGEVLYGESKILDGLPARSVSLVMQSAASAGVPARNWNTEVDFSGPVRHATLLVVADPYGRFRPRLALDGPETATADPGAATVPVAPTPRTVAPLANTPNPVPR